jgi:rod shape-determining protein MreC
MQDYFILLDVRDQNRKLKADNDRLRMENIYYRNQLSTAEHARALTIFQTQTQSKTVAARVIGNSTVATAKAVFIDRGSTSGVEKGMAVVTPDGIVGKVVAVYPLVSQVLLVTDPTFKVGVESQKGHIHGILDCGSSRCLVEQTQDEDKISNGEWFFTSGEDRIFPKGFPVGTVTSVTANGGSKEVRINLSGAPGGVEEVLVVLEGIHQTIPVGPPVDESAVKMLPPPPPEKDTTSTEPGKVQTDADKIVQQYEAIGKEQGHKYGDHASNIPDFNAKPPAPPPDQKTAATPAPPVGAATRAATPSVLGAPLGSSVQPLVARPAPPVNATPKQVAPHPVVPKPVLPLGAPHPKAPPTATNTPSPSNAQQANPQQ